jgi:hypothetical protein
MNESSLKSTLRLLLLAVGICLHTFLIAQQKLVMHITHISGKTTRVLFHEGDEFRFRIKNNPHIYTSVLTGIADSTLYLDEDYSVELRDLDKIYVNRSNFLTRKLSKFFFLLGVGYPGLNAFNNMATGMQPLTDQTTLIFGGTCVGAGILLKVAFRHTYTIGSRCTLWILG